MLTEDRIEIERPNYIATFVKSDHTSIPEFNVPIGLQLQTRVFEKNL